jgi:hypothetical protein
MYRKSLKTRGWILFGPLLFLSLSCTNISDFSEPFMQEVALSNVSILPSVSGLDTGGRAVTGVGVVGNSSGRTVSIFGLPKNEPFKVLGDVTSPDSTPKVSGLEAEVVDKRTLKVIDFTWRNRAAEDLDLKVTGTIVRQGPRLTTLPGDPIVITGRVKPLIDYIPKALRSRLIYTPTKKTVDELDPDDRVPLYQIQISGDFTSIL